MEAWEKKVVWIESESGGWLVMFDCKHTVWFAIEPVKDQVYPCSVCFEEWRKTANEKLGE